MSQRVSRTLVVVMICGLLLGPVACGRSTQPPTPVPAPTPSASPDRAPVVDVKDLGARGDGRTDDRPAIQAALDRAHVLSAEVVFPAGRFLLGSSTVPGDRLLQTFPNQHLRGAGREQTTIIVSPTAGDYVTVIGARTDATGTGAWSLRGVTIDQEASRGAALDVPRMNAVPRMAVRLGDYRAGSSVIVTDSAFVDSDNVNTLYLFAATIEVSRNRFSEVGGPVGTQTHDHSTVYLTATAEDGAQRITGNTFAGVRGSGGARTAVETHGGRQDVRNNVITNFLRGFNITGVASVPAAAVSVRANRIDHAAIGVQLWSDPASGAGGRSGLEVVELDDNQMTLDGKVWEALPGIDIPTSAVLVNPTNTAVIVRVRLTSNVIRYVSTGSSAAARLYNAAVSCRTAQLSGAVQVLEAFDNQSLGAPVWIDSSCPHDSTLIRNNQIR